MAMNAYSHTRKFICTYIFPGRHNFTDSLIPTEIHLLLDRKRHSTVWRRLKSSNNLFFTCTWVWYFPKPSWNLSTHKSRGFILSLKWTSVLFPIIQHPFTLLLLTALWQFPYKITTCVILTLCALCRGDFSPPSWVSTWLGSGPSVDCRPPAWATCTWLGSHSFRVNDRQHHMTLERHTPKAVAHLLASI